MQQQAIDTWLVKTINFASHLEWINIVRYVLEDEFYTLNEVHKQLKVCVIKT